MSTIFRMQSNAHLCSEYNKFFNSEQQWKAHNVGKKYKCNYETASKRKVKESELTLCANPNSIHEDIQKLQSLGTLVPRIVNKVIKCQKIKN